VSSAGLPRGPACADQLKADEAKVQTTRWDPANDLPDLGQYLAIHWQARALGNPCSQAPGPTDWMYEGVVQLRPEDARSLAGKYEWQVVTGATSLVSPGPQVWPALASFVTADVRWMHSAHTTTRRSNPTGAICTLTPTTRSRCSSYRSLTAFSATIRRLGNSRGAPEPAKVNGSRCWSERSGFPAVPADTGT
jgi:hypothetical protein